MMQRLGQAFVAFLLFASFSVPGLSVADRPNVLFLAVDDMKDWVNCLGGYEGTVHTPNIDRLAKRGILFTNAHCPSPKCAPSRAAIMTGLRPSSTGLYDNNHWWYPNWRSSRCRFIFENMVIKSLGRERFFITPRAIIRPTNGTTLNGFCSGTTRGFADQN